LLGGNAGRRPLNDCEARPKLGVPRAPAHFRADNRLAKLALGEYRRMGRLLLQNGLVTQIDGSLLAQHADAYARWVVASEGLQEHGMLVKGAKGDPVRSPYAALVNQAFTQMHKIALEFGVGPSARSRVHATPPEHVDEFAKFLARGPK
jgi:P27 family predicted phage terminase small subunit